MKRKILLATTENRPSAARLAGALAMLGAGVEAVFPHRHVLGVCRYLDRAWHSRPRHAREAFAEALRRSAPDLVVPCDRRALTLLLEMGEFAPLIERSLGPLDGLALLTTRAASIAAARREGIVAPPTVAIPDRAALPYALAEVGLPCVLHSDRAGAVGAATRREAARAFRRLRRPGSVLRTVLRQDGRADGMPIVSIQAAVSGNPGTTAFAARSGRLLAVLHLDTAPGAGHMRRVDCPAMAAAAGRIAARFGLTGFCGLDYIRDREGVPHLIAIRPYATEICHLALGQDLAAALLGEPPRPEPTDGREIALFPQLLTAPELPRWVFRDIPWDDPAVLKAASGDALPEAQGLELIPEFMRPPAGPPIFRPQWR